MANVKMGVIGAGSWGRHHVQNYGAADHVDVVAIADTDVRRAQALAEANGVPNAYGSVAELLANKEIEAVSIVIPNKFHSQVAIQALKAGKHVMLDKPFALNIGQARKVIAAAKEADRIFTMGMNQRFEPHVQSSRLLVEKGELGEVYHARAYWLRRHGIPGARSWFGNKSMSGGGPMMDIGVHLLDACLYVIDNFEPVSVWGAMHSTFGAHGYGAWNYTKAAQAYEFDVEDLAIAMIRMANGATVHLEASWVMHMEESNRMDIECFGNKASAGVKSAKLHKPGRRKGEFTHSEIVPPARLPFPHGSRYQHYVNVIRGKEKQLVSWDQSLAVQGILDAAYESARKGREVPVKR